jgi:hypothetical protein
MPHSPIGPTAQLGFANPYLISFLQVTLGEQGYTIQRLASAIGWDQDFIAKVTELALALGLITPASLVPSGAVLKARLLRQPETADILVLPVSVRPRTEPQPPKPLSERRDPASWSLEGLADVAEAPAPRISERQPTQPASWIVDRENDDG